MTRLHIDIESRSTVDLTKTGVYVYAESSSTEITMVCFAFGDSPPRPPWFPPLSTRGGDPIPADLLAALLDPTITLVAHNSGFERIMLTGGPGRRIGIPCDALRPLGRWNCTAARAAAMGLPRSLEGALAAMDAPVRKDAEGNKVMKRMMKPLPGPRAAKGEPKSVPGVNCPIVWLDDDASLQRCADYCAIDVIGEQWIDKTIPELSATERFTWILTERMNDRGVRIDLPLVACISGMVEEAEAALNEEIREATGYVPGVPAIAATKTRAAVPAVLCKGVPKVSNHGALTRWLVTQGADDDTYGLGTDGVGKAALAAMCERTDLSPLVRQILLLRMEGGGSANTKYLAMYNRTSADGRARGALVYGGAAATMRWSSRGIQLQNLKRASLFRKYKQVMNAIRDVQEDVTIATLGDLYGPVLLLAAELLRSCIVADDGCWLARGDSKQIEARVAPWLAGAEWKLEAFRRFDAKTGPDLYKIAAAGIYKISPDEIADDDPRRQIGKVSELSLGFQGGPTALQAMARGYGMKIPAWVDPGDGAPPTEGTDRWIVSKWRSDNPEFSGNGRDGAPLGLWRAMEDASIACMLALPGKFHPVAGRAGELGVGFFRTELWLGMRLPSGRVLHYWTARVVWKNTPWGSKVRSVVYRAEDSVTKQWREFSAYGGLWVENLVQATARDLMAYWLQQLQIAGHEPRLTVHDEAVCEMPKRLFPAAKDAARAVEEIMRLKPAWAGDLPVSADSSAEARYVKA